MMRKFLLWDNDGVLVDTERWYFTATRECLAGVGIALDQETYLKFMAQGHSCWDLARRAAVPDAVITHARSRRDSLYQKFLREEAIEIPGVLEVLRQLHGVYRMAMVSTSRRADLEIIHQSRGMLEFFEFILAFEDCPHAKPLPAPYLEALRRFEASPREAIAIEDSSRGLQSAVSAGIDCVVVRSDFTTGQDFSKAWVMIPSIDLLPSVIGAPQTIDSRFEIRGR